MRGFVSFAVDNIPISAILRSLFTQEGTLPERSVAGWGGGACGGGVPLRPPGRPPESGLAQPARRKRLRRLCVGQKAKPLPGVVSLPALDYAGAVSESALRRDGEGRSPMDPLRVTGSVGRGVKSSPALREVGFRPRRQTGATLRAGAGWNTCPRDRETPSLGMEDHLSRRKEGQPSPVGSVG